MYELLSLLSRVNSCDGTRLAAESVLEGAEETATADKQSVRAQRSARAPPCAPDRRLQYPQAARGRRLEG